MNLKEKNIYGIELDGEIYSLDEEHLKQLTGLKDIEGNSWIISDMQEVTSRVMTIEAPFKYTEVMLRKKLQETGEFDGPVSIITHWKKKKNKGTTDIFFSAIPTNKYFQYLDEAKDGEDNVLLFPLFSVLHSLLKNIKPEKPIAIIFQHGRSADILVGSKKKIYHANRNIAFDTSEEQIRSLWETTLENLKRVEEENKIEIEKILLLNWVNSQIKEDWGVDAEKLYSMEEETITIGEDEYNLSLTYAIKQLSPLDSISPRQDKATYYIRKAVPYLNILFCLAAFILMIGFFWNGYQNKVLKSDIAKLESEKTALIKKGETAIPKVEYRSTFSFAKELEFCNNAPPYKEIINNISEALSPGMEVNVLKVDYTPTKVNIEIFVEANITFNKAQKGYKKFVQIIRNKGYQIREHNLNTEVSSSNFLVKITKKIK